MFTVAINSISGGAEGLIHRSMRGLDRVLEGGLGVICVKGSGAARHSPLETFPLEINSTP